MKPLSNLKEVLELAADSGALTPRTAIQNLIDINSPKVHRPTEEESSKIRRYLEEVVKVLETETVTFCREALKPTGKVYETIPRTSGTPVNNDVCEES
ncbi:hypothetical protein KKF38_02805 [Patescibacteria group bacterium]|nr:hypothetical protein [Patescibacteria group bacterium]